MSDQRPPRPDPRERPPDPAGTRPRHDPQSLLPQTPAPPLIDTGPAPAGMPAVPRPADPPPASRFQFLFGALIAVAIASIAAVIAIAVRPDSSGDNRRSWSAWRPAADGGAGARQIAAHVGRQYKLPNGRQLVVVTGGPLEAGGLPLTPALRERVNRGGEIKLFEGEGVLYRLCGLGANCSITSGKPSSERHLLLRREALELALYSFRYLGGVDDVVVFLPPSPGKTPTEALFFVKPQLEPQLGRPLYATLPAPVPTVSNVARSPDAQLVDDITTATMFKFRLSSANQDKRGFLVLRRLKSRNP